MVSKNCDFCDTKDVDWRIIRTNKLVYSCVAKHWFTPNDCLVIPIRHVTKPSDLTPEEGTEVMLELGRLSSLLDKGFGTGIMQKYQPLQPENGIKMNHLHFHVFPRLENDTRIFPSPEPNNFEGVIEANEEDIAELLKTL